MTRISQTWKLDRRRPSAEQAGNKGQTSGRIPLHELARTSARESARRGMGAARLCMIRLDLPNATKRFMPKPAAVGCCSLLAPSFPQLRSQYPITSSQRSQVTKASHGQVTNHSSRIGGGKFGYGARIGGGGKFGCGRLASHPHRQQCPGHVSKNCPRTMLNSMAEPSSQKSWTPCARQTLLQIVC